MPEHVKAADGSTAKLAEYSDVWVRPLPEGVQPDGLRRDKLAMLLSPVL